MDFGELLVQFNEIKVKVGKLKEAINSTGEVNLSVSKCEELITSFETSLTNAVSYQTKQLNVTKLDDTNNIIDEKMKNIDIYDFGNILDEIEHESEESIDDNTIPSSYDFDINIGNLPKNIANKIAQPV